MKVLITGGSSLIGRGVAEALAARGDEVIVLQRSHVDGLPDGVGQCQGDIADPAAVADALAGCDGVVHLAAKVGVVGERSEYQRVNVEGTRTLLHAAHVEGVSRFVHVSSPSVAHDGTPIIGGGADPAITDPDRRIEQQVHVVPQQPRRVGKIAEVHSLGVEVVVQVATVEL